MVFVVCRKTIIILVDVAIIIIPADAATTMIIAPEEMTDEMSAQKIVVTDVMRAEEKKGVRKDGKRGVKRDVKTVADGIPMTAIPMVREPLPGRYEKVRRICGLLLYI